MIPVSCVVPKWQLQVVVLGSMLFMHLWPTKASFEIFPRCSGQTTSTTFNVSFYKGLASLNLRATPGFNQLFIPSACFNDTATRHTLQEDMSRLTRILLAMQQCRSNEMYDDKWRLHSIVHVQNPISLIATNRFVHLKQRTYLSNHSIAMFLSTTVQGQICGSDLRQLYFALVCFGCSLNAKSRIITTKIQEGAITLF